MTELFNSQIGQIAMAVLLSLIPVLVWMLILFNKSTKYKKDLKKGFLFGTLSVLPLIGLQFLWTKNPEYNIYQYALRSGGQNIEIGYVLMFMLAGALEEIVKFLSLLNLSWFKIKIQSVSHAIFLMLATALGFAFTENIFYFSSAIESSSISNIYSVFVIRSLFTMAAHMLFSGIVAYYYAIGKFGNPIMEVKKWMGKRVKVWDWLKNKMGLKSQSLFQLSHTFFGLFVAMAIHATFNSAIQFQLMDYAFLIVIIGFLFVIYLSRKRMSYLVFTDSEKEQKKTIGDKEENVIIELLGMWLNEGKYKEVIEVANRLLLRDPNNIVIHLFKAKAYDGYKWFKVKEAIKILFSKEPPDIEKNETSVFDRFKQIKKDQQLLVQKQKTKD